MWDPAARIFACVTGAVCVAISIPICLYALYVGLFIAASADPGDDLLAGLAFLAGVVVVAGLLMAAGLVLVVSGIKGRRPSGLARMRQSRRSSR